MHTQVSPLVPTRADIDAARERLQGVALHTPLLQMHTPSYAPDAPRVWLKPENLQPIGSFKMRGIANAVAALSPERRALGVRTVSSGNTAQAIAWSGRRYGVDAVAIMPDTTPANKIQATERYGGRVELTSREEAFGHLRDGGYRQFDDSFIHPVANTDVLAGHGTLALELLQDLPNIDAVLVPIGGGGLICGISIALRAMGANVRVIGVQPEGCTPIITGLAAGEVVDVPANTICDGVKVGFMFPEMHPLLAEYVDDIVTVPDIEVLHAMRHLVLRQKLVVEPAAALAVAAALHERRFQNQVAVITGGSVEEGLLAALLQASDDDDLTHLLPT